MALSDWCAELRLIEREIALNSEADKPEPPPDG